MISSYSIYLMLGVSVGLCLWIVYLIYNINDRLNEFCLRAMEKQIEELEISLAHKEEQKRLREENASLRGKIIAYECQLRNKT